MFAQPEADDRVVVAMPTRLDSERTVELLAELHIAALICSDVSELCYELRRGAGAVLLTEEVLLQDRTGQLAELMRDQPAWSALPFLVLTREGASYDARRLGLSLGINITLIERPVRTRTLVSIVEAALRGRRHQYQIRDQIVASEHQANELRGQDEKLRFALSAAKLGAWELEITTNALSCSEQCKAICGLAPGEPASYERLHACVYEQDIAFIEAAVTHSIRTGEDYDVEYRVRWPSGELRWVLVRGRVTYDEARNPLRMLGVILDVTESKRLHEALEASRAELSRQADQLREADRRKDEFLATLAHELRNPLAPIQTGLDLLKTHPAPKTAERTLATMGRQLGHMVRLIDDLLDVSRITRGKLELKREHASLSAVVNAAVEASQPYFQRGGQTLRVSLPEGALWFDVDSTRIAQAISNLLNNASKYTPRGGKVELSARREQGNVIIEVRDDGIGIPPERLDDVFEMFRQVHRTLNQSQGGLGIGLALVRKLVELHGGSARAASQGPGRGSTFTITLPLAAQYAEAEPRESVRPESHGKRILVVDDNDDAAELLSLVLENAGHRTQTVGDGPSALAAVESFQPEVVFLDIGLPGMSGYEVARVLRNDRACTDLTLIALTGWGSSEDKQRSAEAGIDFHLTKPVDIRDVHRVLSTLSTSPEP